MPWPRLLAAAFLTLPLLAQADRHELSLRLRAAEQQLSSVADPTRRKAGLGHFEEAAAGFFAFDFGQTAKALSLAELAMAGAAPHPTVLFAHALTLRPKWRLVDAAAGTLPAELQIALPRIGERPTDLRFSAWVAGDPVAEAIGDLPAAIDIRLPRLPEGDHVLPWRVTAGDRPLLTRQQPVSVLANAAERLDRIAAAAAAAGHVDVDAATLRREARELPRSGGARRRRQGADERSPRPPQLRRHRQP